LLEECRNVDPALSAWVAASIPKPFAQDMLPVLRVRVKTVLVRFKVSGDLSTPIQFDVDDMMTGLARQRAHVNRARAKVAVAS